MRIQQQSMAIFQNAVLIFMAIFIAAVIFVIDLNTDSSVAVAGMYAVVILYSWLLPGRYSSIYAAVICTILTIIAAAYAQDLREFPGELSRINAVVSSVVIWTCVTLVFIAKSSFSNLESINKKLSENSSALLENLKELDRKQEELTAQQVQLEKLNSDLLIKNRELERFTSIASHDLQEPLRTIGNMTQLISRKYTSDFDDKGRQMLDYVITATQRMTALIKGLLEFSRIGSKRILQPIDCQELVDTIVLDLDAKIKSVGGTVQIQPLPQVNGNLIELRTLFQNLISNALKFNKVGVPPVVEIKVRNSDAYLEFCVKDNGIGIDEEDYEKIFFIFQRLHPVEQYEGIGLGLAYCRKIVELHGGKIWINSSKGNGSEFYFTLSKL